MQQLCASTSLRRSTLAQVYFQKFCEIQGIEIFNFQTCLITTHITNLFASSNFINPDGGSSRFFYYTTAWLQAITFQKL
jgi:hypothetical protein